MKKLPYTLERLVGIAGSQQDLARVLGRSVEHVSRIANGHQPVPEYMTIILELLDAIPQDRALPRRWHGEFEKARQEAKRK